MYLDIGPVPSMRTAIAECVSRDILRPACTLLKLLVVGSVIAVSPQIVFGIRVTSSGEDRNDKRPT